MRQDLIIVGIDPGVTTAYAVLDVDGHVRKLKSSKELALNNLLAEITNEGKVLVIGTDVKHIPGLIEKFSAKVGAKVIVPEEEVTLTEGVMLGVVFTLKLTFFWTRFPAESFA